MRDSSRRLGALLGSTVLLACAPAGHPERPSILLVVVDTLRRDHLGAYGYERATSHELDRLAADSVRYDAAQSSAPWTLPAVASLLTGRDAHALGIEAHASVVAEELVLLPELLRERGYVTGAIVSHTLVSARWGFDQGFDHFDDSQAKGHRLITSPRVTEAALDFLREQRAEPFFLLVHYFDPHYRYREHEGFRFERDAPYEGPIHDRLSYRELGDLHRQIGPADSVELQRLYDSEIAYTDHHIGRVLDALRELGLYDRMLIAVTADHGEEFLERGRLGHGYSLNEELVGVPLIVRFPGGEPSVVSGPVAVLDLFPTILEVAGAAVPPGLDGVSLLDESSPERLLFAATERGQGIRGVRSGRFKLLHPVKGHTVLYDLEADLLEQRNLFREGGPQLRRLVAALRRYEDRLGRRREPAERLTLTPEETERLRDLGYLDAPQP